MLRSAATAAAAFVLLLALPALAQTVVFVQVDGRAMLPVGDWSDNFSFPDQTHLSEGPGGTFAVGWAPRASRFFTVGIEGGYSQVGTGKWEAFTARHGEGVDAAARMWSVMAAGTLSLPGRGTGTFAGELHGALGVLVPSGEERHRGSTVDYAFLRPTIAGRVGGRGVWRFGALDFWLGLDLLVAPGGVRHTEALPSANGPLVRSLERRTLTALEPGLGLRYWFGL